MPNANFITQFEYKLNNLTGSETQAELLALRATSDKYVDDLNSGAVALLDAAIDADASALTNTSTIKELVTVGNADAEIKSGGGLPINSLMAINTPDLLHTANDDTVWLKTGVIEDDIASYPDATVTPSDIIDANYSGFNFSVVDQDINQHDLTWDGTYFWVVGYVTDAVYQYSSEGVYTGFSFSVAGQDTTPLGVVFDGSHLWVVGGSTGAVYQYTTDGTYTGNSFLVSDQIGNASSITWDGTYFWIIDTTTDEVYKYTHDGTYAEVGFSVVIGPEGIVYDGSHLWVVSRTNNAAYKYTLDGKDTGLSFTIEAQDTNPMGITWDGDYLLIYGRDNNNVYQYTTTGTPDYVGVSTATNDTSGIPNYTRIK